MVKESELWGAVKSNQFWGKRSGMKIFSKDFPGGICYSFKNKKWANGKNNSGPVGHKARRNMKG